MNWEETIIYIRQRPEYAYLVEKAFFEANLPLNIERFENGEEFSETLNLLNSFAPNAKTILDIGCGNGISAISFARKGYAITAVEPDSSNTIGAGAVRLLKKHYGLENIEIFEAFAEEIQFPANSFDVVYIRQAMHHAYNLKKFIEECARVLKPGGILFTVRDHVVFDDRDKEWFLESHPLHKFYGGENAFSATEYRNAFTEAGLEIEKELKYYDSPLNYFPISSKEIAKKYDEERENQVSYLKSRIGALGSIPIIQSLYFKRIGFSKAKVFDERRVPGRMYSFIAKKTQQ